MQETQETQFWPLGWEDPLEKEIATQYSCLGNPMDGGPGGLPSMGSQRVGHNGAMDTFQRGNRSRNLSTETTALAGDPIPPLTVSLGLLHPLLQMRQVDLPFPIHSWNAFLNNSHVPKSLPLRSGKSSPFSWDSPWPSRQIKPNSQ